VHANREAHVLSNSKEKEKEKERNYIVNSEALPTLIKERKTPRA